jgi:hypothetical protein
MVSAILLLSVHHKSTRCLGSEKDRVVGDGAVHGEALVETTREGYRHLASRGIVGGERANRKAGRRKWL